MPYFGDRAIRRLAPQRSGDTGAGVERIPWPACLSFYPGTGSRSLPDWWHGPGQNKTRAGKCRWDCGHVRVGLRHSEPLIWREVEVPTSITLKVLHDIIQAVMGWFDCHGALDLRLLEQFVETWNPAAIFQRAVPSSKNSMCDELVDNPDYDDSHYNEHPIGNLHACY